MTASTTHSGTPLIRLSRLRKVFDAGEVETHALSDIDLAIDAGEFVAITGPSGCGKSTMLSILGLLDSPSTGEYWLKGRNIAELDRGRRAEIRNSEIGFVFQSFNLIADLTIEENVELPLTYRAGVDKSTRGTRVREALGRVGMDHRMRHYPAQLSGGQQQRVAIARALVGRPSILLADEPTGNLDSENGEGVMRLLEELHGSGSTLCMVSHDEGFSRRARKVLHMRDGRIVDTTFP